MTLPTLIPYAGGSLLSGGALPARDQWPAEGLRTCAGCLYQGASGCGLGLRPPASALACKRWAPVPGDAAPARIYAPPPPKPEFTPLQARVLDVLDRLPGAQDATTLSELIGCSPNGLRNPIKSLLRRGLIVELPRTSGPRRFTLATPTGDKQ